MLISVLFALTDNENLLSGQLDEMASDVAVLVFETDEVPCKDIVRSVDYCVVIVVFNKTQTLKFKPQPTVYSRPLGKQKFTSAGSKGHVCQL